MIIGTWNTRSLHRTGALKELTKAILNYNIDIIAVQETRWKGSGTSETKTHTIFHSDSESRHELGVAFIVNNRIKGSILDFRPIDERLCTLRIKTRFFNMTLINAHAETEEKDEITKESFYQKLEQAHDGAPSNDIKMVLGGLNAKIGKEPEFRQVAGEQSLHKESNDNGIRTINFAISRNMVISSTYFSRRDIHK